MKKIMIVLVVTGLQDRVHPGKVALARDLIGTGTPGGDTTLADDVEYPIGSTYTNKTTGKLYTKTSSATWVVTGAGS